MSSIKKIVIVDKTTLTVFKLNGFVILYDDIFVNSHYQKIEVFVKENSVRSLNSLYNDSLKTSHEIFCDPDLKVPFITKKNKC